MAAIRRKNSRILKFFREVCRLVAQMCCKFALEIEFYVYREYPVDERGMPTEPAHMEPRWKRKDANV